MKISKSLVFVMVLMVLLIGIGTASANGVGDNSTPTSVVSDSSSSSQVSDVSTESYGTEPINAEAKTSKTAKTEDDSVSEESSLKTTGDVKKLKTATQAAAKSENTNTSKSLKTDNQEVVQVTSANVETYFNDDGDGYSLTSSSNNKVLVLDSTVPSSLQNRKYFYFTDAGTCTITGGSNNVTFTNQLFKIDGTSNITISNISFVLDDTQSFPEGDKNPTLFDISANATIENCKITVNIAEFYDEIDVGSSIIAIDTPAGSNKYAIFKNCSLSFTIPTENINYDSIYTGESQQPRLVGMYVKSGNARFIGNNISVKESATTGVYATMEPFLFYGDNNVVLNNSIYMSGKYYLYGMYFKDSSNNTISGNNITANGSKYTNGIYFSGKSFSNNNVSNNFINLTSGNSSGGDVSGNAAEDSGYAINMENMGQGGTLVDPDAITIWNFTVTNNTIVMSGYNPYGIELFGAIGNTIIANNTINATGHTPSAITMMGYNSTIVNNNINVVGETNETEYSADWFRPTTAGIYLKQGLENTIANNSISAVNGAGVFSTNQERYAAITGNNISVDNEFTVYADDTSIGFVVENNTLKTYGVENNDSVHIIREVTTSLTVTLDNPVIYVGDNVVVSVKLVDADNNAIGNAHVVLTVGDDSYDLTTDSNGMASVTYGNTTVARNITVYASFNGDASHYASISDTLTLAVSKMNTTLAISLNKDSFYVGDDVVVSVKLVDADNNAIGNASVALTVGGDGYDLTTDANGTASVTYADTAVVRNLTIYASYSGNSYYNSARGFSIVMVSKMGTALTVALDKSSVYVGDDVTVSVKLVDEFGSAVVNGTVVLTVGNDSFDLMTDANGEATKTYAATASMGDVQVVARYDGTSRYNPSTSNALTFDVVKMNTTLTVALDKSSVYVGDDVTVSVELVDEFDSAVVNGTVVLTVGNDSFDLMTDANGMATKTYTAVASSDDTRVFALFDGDSRYNPGMSNVLTFDVSKVDTTLTVNAGKSDANESNIIVNVKLVDEFNNAVANVPVVLTVNNENFNVTTDANGSASKTHVISETEDSIQIVAAFNGNSRYNSSASNVLTYNISKVATNLDIGLDKSAVYVGDDVVVSVKLVDEFGSAVVNGTVVLTVGNDSFELMTDANGAATKTYTAAAPAEGVRVAAMFDGTSRYNPSTSHSLTFDVSKMNTNLVVGLDKSAVYVDDDVVVSVKLVDEFGSAVVNGTVVLTVGNDSFDLMTDANGTATKTYTAAAPVGEVQAVARYGGNSRYNASASNVSTFTVSKIGTALTVALNKTMVYVYDNQSITVKLVDANGNAIANAPITLTVNNQEFNLATDSNGLATYTYNATVSQVGIQAYAVFNGTDKYDSCTSEVKKFSVSKYGTYIDINLDKTEVHVGDNLTVTVKLYDGKKNGISNLPIGLIINGQTYGLTTDANGLAMQNYTAAAVKEGAKVSATFAGNAYYGYKIVDTTFDIVKKNANLTVALGKSELSVGDTQTVTVELVDEFNNAIANETVVLTVGNKNYTVTTDSNGRATQDYTTAMVESVEVNARFSGNSICNPTNSNTATFNVSKVETSLTCDVDTALTALETNDIKGTLMDSNNNPLSNALIKIYLNGSLIGSNLTNSAGGYSYAYVPTSEGTNIPLSVVYEGDDKYLADSVYSVANIDKTVSNLSLDSVGNTVVNGTVVIAGSLTGTFAEKAIANATVKVVIAETGGVYTTTTDNNGVFAIATTAPSNVGTYTIIAMYGGSNAYNASNSSTTFDVGTLSTTTIVDSVNGIVKDTVSLRAVVMDERNNSATSGKVSFAINGTVVGSADVNNGVAVLKATALKAWNNTEIIATYSGNGIYKESVSDGKIVNVALRTPTLTLINTDLSGKNGETVTFMVYVTEGNYLVNEGKVSFKLNGVTLKDANGGTTVRVANGIAAFDYVIPDNFSAKNYTLSVVYGGNDYERGETTGTLTVLRTNSYMEGNVLGIASNGTATLSIKVFDQYNNQVQRNFTVSIKVNGKTVLGRVTVEDGYATFGIDLIPSSTPYNITIVTGDNSQYYGSKTTVVYQNPLPKYNTNIVTKATVGKTSTALNINLRDDNGNAISGKTKVSVKVDGKTQLSNQVAVDGVLNCNITTPTTSGNHTVTVVSAGTTSYASASADTIIKV